ncbi:HAMP domain-containing sensor histidine kinase [Alicyclobacillus sp.]|uniref:HAMP domain-containing sensor histidine kinase n=1 Tax=Alicyclobacillus sp. TaxID=61169 RepID=UPI0025BC5667|nr:HAMP domain-containing sensor histidine kinase [Alicyclobacillus sp.]MCL6516765.1 HAMP domain-containing histidine kinase [Alicyclobacillus sp.]
MDARNFVADLMCIFLPLLCLDGWYMRRGLPDRPYPSRWVFTAALAGSAVAATWFHFALAPGIGVDLSIIPITLGFYLLPWLLACAQFSVYIVWQLVHSALLVGHGRITTEAILTVLHLLPAALLPIAVYAGLMSAAKWLLRRQRPGVQGAGFAAALLVYSTFDYAWVFRSARRVSLHPWTFASFVLFFTLVFVLAARLILAAREAHERRADAAQGERLRLISQLSASVAHEIRNPITTVRGFTQLMLEQEYNRDRTVAYLDNMLRELDRADAMITHYLELSRREVPDERTEVHLQPLIRHVTELLQPLAGNRSVRLRCDAEEAVVSGSPEPLRQALIHLVRNAIEAHDGPGQVEITLRRMDPHVHITIRDTGRGIPTADLARLGEPFYSTKTKGTGLGLTFVYKVVHELGGRIRVESRPGEGTTFTVWLPALRPPYLEERLRALAAASSFRASSGTPASAAASELPEGGLPH